MLQLAQKMNKNHRQILIEMKKNRRPGDPRFNPKSYLGSDRLHYNLATPVKRQIAKNWARRNREIGLPELVQVINSLYKGESYEEKTLASEILR